MSEDGVQGLGWPEVGRAPFPPGMGSRSEWSRGSDAFSLLPKVKWAQSCRSASCIPNLRKRTQQVSYACFFAFLCCQTHVKSYHYNVLSDLFYREILESTRLQYWGCSVSMYMYTHVYMYLNLKAQNNREKEGC